MAIYNLACIIIRILMETPCVSVMVKFHYLAKENIKLTRLNSSPALSKTFLRSLGDIEHVVCSSIVKQL